MTKNELATAQYLHNVATSASDRAYDLCPNYPDRPGPFGASDHVARSIVAMGRVAADLFWELTGKSVHDVHLVDLSTETPAHWTQTARAGRS